MCVDSNDSTVGWPWSTVNWQWSTLNMITHTWTFLDKFIENILTESINAEISKWIIIPEESWSLFTTLTKSTFWVSIHVLEKIMPFSRLWEPWSYSRCLLLHFVQSLKNWHWMLLKRKWLCFVLFCKGHQLNDTWSSLIILLHAWSYIFCHFKKIKWILSKYCVCIKVVIIW